SVEPLRTSRPAARCQHRRVPLTQTLPATASAGSGPLARPAASSEGTASAMNPSAMTDDTRNGIATPSPNNAPPSNAPSALAPVSAAPTVPAARPRSLDDTELIKKAMMDGSANAAVDASIAPTP